MSKRYVVYDIETNGLSASLIHCLSYIYLDNNETGTLTDYESMKRFLTNENHIFICHNGIRYDKVQASKILNIKITGQTIDTLGLSWYLYDDRKEHGLESWGEEFGVPKPKIDDWENLTIEDYSIRCQEDCKINKKLFEKCYYLLQRIYDYNEVNINLLYKYLEFKLSTISIGERVGINFDSEFCQEHLTKLEEELKAKALEIQSIMPKVPIYKEKKKPVQQFTKSGDLTSHYKKWLIFLDDHDLEEDTEGPIKYISGYEEPNPDSVLQKKEWLYSLGWVPQHFKYNKDKKAVAQIKHKDPERYDEVCDSIKELFEKEPKLQLLEGYTVVDNRIKTLRGFLRDQKNGRLYSSVGGLTNTLRLKHKTVKI